MTDAPVPAGRDSSEYDLIRRQLDGIDRFNTRRRQQVEASLLGQRSREQRLDLARRMDVLREQQRAIIARTDRQLRESAHLLAVHARPRAILVHRNAWFTDKVAAGLVERGVEVVARLTNGAEAVGAAVAEQPDLLLVEDTLPMLPGELVVREVLGYAPGTLVTAQVATDAGIGGMLEAGACAAYARRVPPGEVALRLAELLPVQRR